MATHVVVTLMAAFLLALTSVWVLPKRASSPMFLMAHSPGHLSEKQVEELVHELQGLQETVKKLNDKVDAKVDQQEDELDALVRAAKASISPWNASSVNLSAKAAIFPRTWPSMEVGGRRLSDQGASVIDVTADFLARHSVTNDKWASLPGYVENNFWASTIAVLVGDTMTLTNDIVLRGATNNDIGFVYERALVNFGIGVSAALNANPVLGALATFAYSMFSSQRSQDTSQLANSVNVALNRLYEKVMEDTTQYTDAKVELEMLNAARDANREAIAAVMDEMLWVPEMLYQASGLEDAEQKQTRVMYQLVLQHDLAKLSTAVFGDCVYDPNSADCKTWQEKGTFVQAIVFATLHLQVLNDIAINDARYVSAISTRLKEVSNKYRVLLQQSAEAMDRKIKCNIGVHSYCVQNGVSVAGLPGLWFHASNTGMTCDEVCDEEENMVFDVASSQHTGIQAGAHFVPTWSQVLYRWDRCASIEHSGPNCALWIPAHECGNFHFPADGSTPKGDCRVEGRARASCACKYVAVSSDDDPNLLIKFDAVIASFNIGKCTAPRDGIISNARDTASGGPCAEGAVFDTAGENSSAICTATCENGFTPSVETVPCTSGYPDVLFRCIPDLTYTKFGDGPCRATSPTDNPAAVTGGWYFRPSFIFSSEPSNVAASLADCKAYCDSHPSCKAIEVTQNGQSNWCEVWFREPLYYADHATGYACYKKDTRTPHFPAATAGLPALCQSQGDQGGTPATQEECAFACTHQKVAGATSYTMGSWSHSPGCFVVVDGQYRGGCHWNTNTAAVGSHHNARPVCTKPDYRTRANCVDTDNGATNWFGKACQSYTESLGARCPPDYYYEDEDFSPDSMCCACGGGTM